MLDCIGYLIVNPNISPMIKGIAATSRRPAGGPVQGIESDAACLLGRIEQLGGQLLYN
jgi:hypothetical protein